MDTNSKFRAKNEESPKVSLGAFMVSTTKTEQSVHHKPPEFFTPIALLNILTGTKARCPRPLEVIAAQVPCDVDHLANEVQARDFFAFKGFG